MTHAEHRPVLRDMRRLIDPTAMVLAEPPTARTATVEELSTRQGYAPDFLKDMPVPLPLPYEALAEDVTPVLGREDGRLDYTHFSLVMSRSRRLALFTAVNIDSSALVSVPRGSDHWRFDPRIDPSLQAGPDLYSRNPLDRGHLVRRTAPNWGDEAEQANDDTFYFTNATPQLAGFNQQTWLGLEDYLLDNARADRQRITVFSGPIFDPDDRLYRGIRIPEAYWKVVAFMGDDGRPSATAYMIEQGDGLDQLGFVFGQYRTYQRSVARIEALTGLDFGDLSTFDGFSNEERDTGVRIEVEIRGPADIRV
ncbi:endonuclease G [Kushneria avicenniae]|uniref:Endonuclease G n=1 Tax=Kushneria avicenniae TaxID=402385 RepID=A0A1I1JYC6_9GAMM|nr:DNA/RNA non-specific endonuclease [Kushneria avicenniae]SFC53251.1 endonuclease G [Kushneria avicenniae]